MRRFDSNSHIPKYVLLKNEIVNLIREKQLKPHDRLLSRNELIRHYGVSEITVRKAIDDLTNEGYVYRVHGKGTFVAEARTGNLTIAMMVLHLYSMSEANHMYDVTYVAPMVHSVQQEAAEHGASMLLYFSHDSLEIEKQNLQSALDRRVDGVIFLPLSEWRNADSVARLIQAGTPVVSIDRRLRGVNADSVATDNEAGAYLATKTLIDTGFERIYYFTNSHDIGPVKDRMAGYIRAMSERGLSFERYLHVFPATDVFNEEKVSRSVVKAALEDAKPGFAVFAVNPPAFVGVLNAMRELGLSAADTGLACFDEPPVYVPDNVIYIRVLQPLEDMGARCVRLIMDRLGGSGIGPQHIELPPKLLINRDGCIEEIDVASPNSLAADTVSSPPNETC